MAKKRVNKAKKRLSRELAVFLKDESGAISRESILKVGIGTISALGIFAPTVHAADVSGYQDSGEVPAPAGAVHINADVVKWRPLADGSKEMYPSHVHGLVPPPPAPPAPPWANGY